jgi:hypothetical protein
MARPLAILNLAACLALFHGLGACGTKASDTKAKGTSTAVAESKSDSVRTEAFQTFVKMAKLSCTYKIAEAISSSEIAETECDSAVAKKNRSGPWKEEWTKALSAGLTSQQFDSLCINFIRATSGDMPLPVSDGIKENAKKMAIMSDAALKDLLRLAD